MSALGLAALAVAQGELAAGVRGGLPGRGRFRSQRIDEYMRAVGLAPHGDPEQEGWPWCAAAVHFCFGVAATSSAAHEALMRQAAGATPFVPVANPCPRTAGALHLWDLAPLQCRTQLPAPGDVFVVDHGKGRGHCGIVASVSPDGHTITSVEGDTSASGSSTGDAWGEHFWKPSDGARGKLKGYLCFGE